MSLDLTSKAMIARLSIRGIWSAVAEDVEASRELARQKGIRSDVYRAMKKICDPKNVPSLKAFNSSHAALYNLHRSLTLAWDDKGGRLLPVEMYFDYMTKIEEAKQRMIERYDVLLSEIPVLKQRFRLDPETAGAYRDEDWPDPAELRQKLDVRVRITPLADASDFRVRLGEEEEAKIKAQVTKDLYGQLAGALSDLIGNLKTCVLDTQQRLAAYETDASGKVVRTFRDTAITNLRGMVANARKLNVLGDEGLDSLFAEIENSLCRHDPQTLRDNFVLRKQAVQSAGALAGRLAEIESVLTSVAA